ncbi:hypothetical protein ILYODFUR_006782 [Ilyodon furcidens]|uniref:Uncharacterized protein n=1 Tax=Ilyodon furcidens TaxID=33524 RepID=A0ABV0U4K7_9TELE
MNERSGTPWTGRQSITGQHRDTQDKQPCTHTLITKGNFKRPINITIMFFDFGRQPEYPERTHTCRELANSMQKMPKPGFKPRTFSLHGNSATNTGTVLPPCSPSVTIKILQKIL